MSRRARVVWTMREEELVYTKAADIQSSNNNVSCALALRQAQELVLEPHRQKSDSAFYQGRAQQLFSQWKVASTRTPSTAPQDETAPLAELTTAMALPVGAVQSTDSVQSAASLLASIVATEIVSRIQSELVARIEAMESDLMARLVETGALVATACCSKEDKERLPRVLVVCLRGQQGPELRKEFEGLLRLQWVEAGTSETAIHALRNFSGNVVCMAKFIGHSTESIFKNHPMARTIHGGMTELRETLLEIAANESVKKEKA